MVADAGREPPGAPDGDGAVDGSSDAGTPEDGELRDAETPPDADKPGPDGSANNGSGGGSGSGNGSGGDSTDGNGSGGDSNNGSSGDSNNGSGSNGDSNANNGSSGDTTPPDPPPPPPWVEPEPPVRNLPTCTGSALSCGSRSLLGCTQGDGCRRVGDCEGFARSCYSQYSSYSCRSQDGCYWSTYSDNCSGSARSCSLYSGSTSCRGQDGCRWEEDCVGSATDCDNLGAASCGLQPGCYTECEAGAALCDGQCVDLLDDEQHCGACGFDCGPKSRCTDGVCECGAPYVLCDGRCIDPRSSQDDCGQCGNRCGDGFVCQAGACQDVDECALNPCRNGRSCSNTPGGFACGSCGDGLYADSATTCADVNECARGQHDCDPLADCINTYGSFRCGPCPAGYDGDGASGCTDIDECATANGGCHPLTECANTPGGFACGDCPEGYQGSGYTGCRDINECDRNNGGCDSLTTCTNTEGSRVCGDCPAGYAGSGTSGCDDIDECAVDNGGCDVRRLCVNASGSHSCGACEEGYVVDGPTSCADIDECASDNGGCDALTECTNVDGGRECGACPDGYSGSGEAGCVDIDECDTADLGGCDPLAGCRNLPGSFECLACPAGYSGTGESGCSDIDECAVDGTCDSLSECRNLEGSHECGECPQGYRGDGSSGCIVGMLDMVVTGGTLDGTVTPDQPTYIVDLLEGGPQEVSLAVTVPDGAQLEIEGQLVTAGATVGPFVVGEEGRALSVRVSQQGKGETVYTVDVRSGGDTFVVDMGIDMQSQFMPLLGRMAMDGDTFVMMAEHDFAAQLHVYRRRGREWVRETVSGDLPFLLESVSVKDDRIVVGGWAAVADRTPEGHWHFEALSTELTSCDNAQIVGELIYVSDICDTDDPSVRVFEQRGGNWELVERIPAPAVVGGNFGRALHVSGETLVASDLSYIHVYESQEGGWVHGSSVPVEGRFLTGLEDGVMVTYDRDDDTAATDAGAVFLHSSAVAWGVDQTLTAPNAGSGDRLFSAGINTGRILACSATEDSSAIGIGGDPDNDDAADAGAMYLFDNDGSGFGAPMYIKPLVAGESFGGCVLGDRYVVGRTRSAQLHIYELP